MTHGAASLGAWWQECSRHMPWFLPATQLLPEACPQCGARFADVAQLVAHAESAHRVVSGAAVLQPGASARGDYRCARCGAAFDDPVHLVAHDERCRGHAGAVGGTTCSVS
jgi:DNA-directed RNA polymerase subunit RPC12/RpoP